MLEDLDSLYGPGMADIQNPGSGNNGNHGQSNNPQYTQNNHSHAVPQPTQQNYQNNNSGYSNSGGNGGGGYNNNNRNYGNNNGGGYNNNRNGQNNYNRNNNGGGYNGGGGGNRFQKKEEVIEEPYTAVSFFIDRDFPDEIKKRLTDLSNRFMAKKITARYNGDDTGAHTAISNVSTKHSEAYIPWKNFNNIDSKHYYNTATANHVASTNFQGWDKVPDAVKAMMARNVRMLFGDKNRSTALCLITWSPDGASKANEVTKETGRSAFIIKLAATYGIPVINIAKPNPELILEKAFNI